MFIDVVVSRLFSPVYYDTLYHIICSILSTIAPFEITADPDCLLPPQQIPSAYQFIYVYQYLFMATSNECIYLSAVRAFMTQCCYIFGILFCDGFLFDSLWIILLLYYYVRVGKNIRLYVL